MMTSIVSPSWKLIDATVVVGRHICQSITGIQQARSGLLRPAHAVGQTDVGFEPRSSSTCRKPDARWVAEDIAANLTARHVVSQRLSWGPAGRRRLRFGYIFCRELSRSPQTVDQGIG